MAAYLRAQGVRTILDFGFTKSLPIAEARAYHDYAIDVQATYPDVIFGHWLQIDPRTGREGVDGIRALRGGEPRLHRHLRLGAGNGLCCERSDIRSVLPGEHRAATSRPCPRRHYGFGCRPKRRRRRPARPFAPALHRRAVGAPSGPHDHRRPQSVAVDRRHDRRAPAQARRVARAARLVAQVPRRFAQARDHAPAEAQGDVRRRLSALHLRAPGRRLGRPGLRPGDAAARLHREREAALPRRSRKARSGGSVAYRQGRDRRRRESGHRLRHRARARRGRRAGGDGRAPARARSTRRSRRIGGRSVSPLPPTSARPTTASASSRAPSTASGASTSWSTTTAPRRSAASTSSTTQRGPRRSSRIS